MAVDFTKNLEKAMDIFHKKGAFLTVKDGDNVNTMTISWGNVGYEWNRPIFTVMVRKARHSYSIIEKGTEFTVSIPKDDSFKEALKICGTKSGKDIDKYKEADISLADGSVTDCPVIKDCGFYYECKIVYKHSMDRNMLDDSIIEGCYGDEDFHTIYFGEIVACYSNDENV